MTQPDRKEAEAHIYWIFVTAYVLSAVGKLPPGRDGAIGRFADNWKDIVETELEVDVDFVKRLYRECLQRMDDTRAVLFIIRGFGCPQVAERIREVLG